MSSKAVHIPETEDRVELFFLDCSGRAFYAPFRDKLVSRRPDLSIWLYLSGIQEEGGSPLNVRMSTHLSLCSSCVSFVFIFQGKLTAV